MFESGAISLAAPARALAALAVAGAVRAAAASPAFPGAEGYGANIAPAVAGSLQIGWRPVGQSAHLDSGALAVYGDAGDSSLTVTGTLYLANGQNQNGTLRQEGGVIAVGGDVRMSSGASFGTWTYDMNEPGTGQVELSGGVLTVGDLDIRSAADNRLVISGGGVLLARQAAYSPADAAADIAAGRIATESGMTVGAVSVGGVSYTRIGRQASRGTIFRML
jgi:hypothetical protein